MRLLGEVCSVSGAGRRRLAVESGAEQEACQLLLEGLIAASDCCECEELSLIFSHTVRTMSAAACQ